MKGVFLAGEDGKIPPFILREVESFLAKVPTKSITLTIEVNEEGGTLSQKKYYRSVVLPHVRKMMYENGDPRSTDAWHEVLLDSFAPVEIIKTMNGTEKSVPKRTSRMKKGELSEFITAITAYCAEAGCPVPMNF